MEVWLLLTKDALGAGRGGSGKKEERKIVVSGTQKRWGCRKEKATAIREVEYCAAGPLVRGVATGQTSTKHLELCRPHVIGHATPCLSQSIGTNED